MVYGHHVHSEMENEVLKEPLSTVFLRFCLCLYKLYATVFHLLLNVIGALIVFPSEIQL